MERLVPAPDQARRIEGLRLAGGQYAVSGIGTHTFVGGRLVTPAGAR